MTSYERLMAQGFCCCFGGVKDALKRKLDLEGKDYQYCQITPGVWEFTIKGKKA